MTAINAPTPSIEAMAPASQPRARGSVRCSVKAAGARSMLDGLRQSGSLKLMFPRRHGPAVEGVLVNTAGGVTGGDRFDLEVTAQPGTAITLTTQAAERAYRAQSRETGRIRNTLTAMPGAQLHWLPQETILFQGSRLDRRLDVELHEDARLLLCEPLVFGRAAMGERLTDAALRDRISVTRDGAPLYLDAFTLSGDIAATMMRGGLGNGAGALATLLYVAPDAESHIAPLREMLPETGGVSQLRDDMLVLRLLAEDSHLLRQSLMPILTRLGGASLPRPWMI